MYRSFFRQYWMLAKQSMISCRYMCPFCKLFNLFFLNFCRLSTEYKGIVYAGFVLYGLMIAASLILIPGVQLVCVMLKCSGIFCLVENTYNAEVCRWWVFFLSFKVY